jgi:hypothetical protein
MSVSNGKTTRHYFRKGYARPCGRPRSTAALVIGIIEARLEDGWPLDQIGWPKFCRESAVIQVVTQQLNRRHHQPREISSWTAPL